MSAGSNSFEHITPFKDEILIRVLDRNDYNDSPIYIPEKSSNEKNHFFEVLKIGSNVTEVKVGDVVVVEWKNAMVPFLWGSDYLSVTAEKHVDAVIDG